MTSLTVAEPRTLFAIVDDLTAYEETLVMLDAQLAEALPDDERAAIQKSRAEVLEIRARIAGEVVTKTDDYAHVLRRMDAEYDIQDSEVDRMRAKREATDKARKWLRSYGVSVMQKNGMRQLKTPTNTLFLRASDAVLITDQAKVPAEYQNAEVKLPLTSWNTIAACARSCGYGAEVIDAVRVKAEPSLSTIKRAIKSGADVPGADLEMRESLVLR